MAEVIMTCGRICSGKSTYAEELRKRLGAVVLSVDEITLALFGQDVGDMHDTYVERTKNYLFEKSVQIAAGGIDVILDWGYWTKEERRYAHEFYSSRGIKCSLHYIDVPDDEWHRRIKKRNGMVAAGECSAYYIDEGIAEKSAELFEPPDDEEIDVRVSDRRKEES